MAEQYTLKIWELTGTLDQTDCEYLRGCTVRFVATQYDTVELNTSSGVYRYYVPPKPTEVVAQTDDQESALLLKYGSRVQLRMVTYAAGQMVNFES